MKLRSMPAREGSEGTGGTWPVAGSRGDCARVARACGRLPRLQRPGAVDERPSSTRAPKLRTRRRSAQRACCGGVHNCAGAMRRWSNRQADSGCANLRVGSKSGAGGRICGVAGAAWRLPGSRGLFGAARFPNCRRQRLCIWTPCRLHSCGLPAALQLRPVSSC